MAKRDPFLQFANDLLVAKVVPVVYVQGHRTGASSLAHMTRAREKVKKNTFLIGSVPCLAKLHLQVRDGFLAHTGFSGG